MPEVVVLLVQPVAANHSVLGSDSAWLGWETEVAVTVRADQSLGLVESSLAEVSALKAVVALVAARLVLRALEQRLGGW